MSAPHDSAVPSLNELINKDDTLPAASEDLLIQFVAYCYNVLKVQYTTIRCYLSGVRYAYMCAGFDNPLGNSNGVTYPTLAMLLKACERKPPIVSLRHRRLPITTDVLYKICAVFNGGYVLTWRDKVMCAACTLAFFAFMRCGEFTVRGGSSAESYLCIDDVDLPVQVAI